MTLHLAKWCSVCVCVLGVECVLPGALRAVCGHCRVVCGCLWVTKSLSDRHFPSSSITCLLSEPARARSAFLPSPPGAFPGEQGNMTGVDMRHAEPNNARYSQACSGLGAGPASSLCSWLIGSKKGFLPLATDGLRGDS